jgi:hypothetical protein
LIVSLRRLVYPITTIVISPIHIDVLESALIHQEAVFYAITMIKALTLAVVVIVAILIVSLEKLLIVGWSSAFTHFLIVLGYL